MSRFPSAKHLCSWAGVAPGNKQSGGKRFKAPANKGNTHLRAILAECVWAISHTRDNYLAAQYHRLARRIGKKRAIVAVSHSLLGIIYHLLRDEQDYHDLGPHYFQTLDTTRQRDTAVRRLQALGYTVTLHQPEAGTPPQADPAVSQAEAATPPQGHADTVQQAEAVSEPPSAEVPAQQPTGSRAPTGAEDAGVVPPEKGALWTQARSCCSPQASAKGGMRLAHPSAFLYRSLAPSVLRWATSLYPFSRFAPHPLFSQESRNRANSHSDAIAWTWDRQRQAFQSRNRANSHSDPTGNASLICSAEVSIPQSG